MAMLPTKCPNCGTLSSSHAGLHVILHQTRDYYVESSDGPLVSVYDTAVDGGFELLCYDCSYSEDPYDIPMGVDLVEKV